jgi:hypothetical protein
MLIEETLGCSRSPTKNPSFKNYWCYLRVLWPIVERVRISLHAATRAANLLGTMVFVGATLIVCVESTSDLSQRSARNS